MCVIYFMISGSVAYLTRDTNHDAFECSQDMYMYLQYALYYFVFVSIRHLCICVAIPCAQRPQSLMDKSNLVYIGMDVFLVVLLTVFGT